MTVEEFKQELEDYGLNISSFFFLDLVDYWNGLSWSDRIELLKYEVGEKNE